jgi:hypothetical protein
MFRNNADLKFRELEDQLNDIFNFDQEIVDYADEEETCTPKSVVTEQNEENSSLEKVLEDLKQY